MADYNFITTWKLDAPLEKVWREMEAAEQWPQWWKGVLKVEQLEKGDAKGIGSVRAFTFKSVAPYELKFNMRLVQVEDFKRIEGNAFGELEGVGIWHFSTDGPYTVVRYDWIVKTTKWWMNAIAPIARPVFNWNHDKIMQWGGEGLAKRLGCELVSGE